MLLSLISPDNNSSNFNSKNLVDNYDIQHMDIVDDHPLPPPLPPHPPPQPPLPPNHLQFFEPLPPLPPPPPSLFDMFTVNQSYSATNWPRPNFVQQTTIPSMQNDLWQTSFNNPTDIDLRLQPIHSIPQINDHISPKKTQQQQQRRKRSKKFSKKHHHERETPSSIPIEKSPVLIPNNDEEDDEEERLLREELLRTLSNKRKVKTNSKPERIVTIIPTNSIQLLP